MKFIGALTVLALVGQSLALAVQTPAAACTSTITALPKFDLAQTETSYRSTATELSTVDCAGCAHVELVTMKLGMGPVRKIDQVVIANLTTTTSYVCAKATPL